MPQQSYYGDKLSEHLTETPEGILICHDVPIGRVGWMDYLGEETPFAELAGQIVKVYRSPDELFSQETIASFEGKSVTNTHPAKLLDVNTIPSTERGHVQNVRQSGDYLVADLFIKDAGLKAEVLEKMKREVSSAYMCEWIPVGERKLEQRGIVGNHVAVVKNGRAGPRVAIHDHKPEGGNEPVKITQKILAAMGFQAFAKEAKPEEIAAAMDAMTEGVEPEKKEPEKKPAADEAPAWAKQLIADVDALKTAATAKPATDAATAVMDAAEKELDEEDKKEAKDADPDPDEDKKDDKKDDKSEEKKEASDAKTVLKKFVQDMKPIIMAIPDEKARLDAANKFVAAVKDARQVGAGNGYADILKTVTGNKKSAMDKAAEDRNRQDATVKATDAWNKAGAAARGGK